VNWGVTDGIRLNRRRCLFPLATAVAVGLIVLLHFVEPEFDPSWRMQVLVDRASRATTDEEMDTLDNDLLKALSELRHLRDRLHGVEATHDAQRVLDTLPTQQDAYVLDAAVEALPEELMPVGRYNAKRLDDRLAATR
jgi:hypothetical protein